MSLSRPDTAALRLLTVEEFETHFDYWSAVVALKLADLGLGLFVDGENSQVAWIGFEREDLVHPHDRWLFRSESFEGNGRFIACGREVEKAADFHHQGQNIGLQSALTDMRSYMRDAGMLLKDLMGAKPRETAWLLAHYQVFGHANATTIALMPETVDWVALHDVVHHHEAWAQAAGATGMPQEIALRMHGLGAVIDRRRSSMFYTSDI
jgi:hypothetical protein